MAGWREGEEQAAVQVLAQPASVLKRALGEDGAGPPSSAVSAARLRSALSLLNPWEGWQDGEPALMSVDAGKVRSPEQSRQADKGLEWFECRLGLIGPVREQSRAPTFYVGGAHGPQDVHGLFRLLAAAWRMGGRSKRPLVFCADGAEWIWRQVALWFPEAVQVLDLYHAGEHVASAALACWGEESERARKWRRHARAMLLSPNGPSCIRRALQKQLEHGNPVNRAQLARELRYLTEHAGRMPYAQLREKGLPVGSGAMESAVKQVSTQRLRQPGMMWTRQGADRMVRLRAAHLSGILPATIARQHARLWKHAGLTATRAMPD